MRYIAVKVCAPKALMRAEICRLSSIRTASHVLRRHHSAQADLRPTILQITIKPRVAFPDQTSTSRPHSRITPSLVFREHCGPCPFQNGYNLARHPFQCIMKPRCSLLLTSIISSLAPLRPVSANLASKNFTINPLLGLQQFPLSFYARNSTTSTNMSRLAPVISISHGGGPMPLLGDPSHAAITKSLKTRVPKILKLGTPDQPRAIVLVTAHWSTKEVAISSGETHELYYDYHGFPKEAYQLKYNAPGSPEVAEMVKKTLEGEGIKSAKDGKRGSCIFKEE
jgi:hypothetical protein